MEKKLVESFVSHHSRRWYNYHDYVEFSQPVASRFLAVCLARWHRLPTRGIASLAVGKGCYAKASMQLEELLSDAFACHWESGKRGDNRLDTITACRKAFRHWRHVQKQDHERRYVVETEQQLEKLLRTRHTSSSIDRMSWRMDVRGVKGRVSRCLFAGMTVRETALQCQLSKSEVGRIARTVASMLPSYVNDNAPSIPCPTLVHGTSSYQRTDTYPYDLGYDGDATREQGPIMYYGIVVECIDGEGI